MGHSIMFLFPFALSIVERPSCECEDLDGLHLLVRDEDLQLEIVHETATDGLGLLDGDEFGRVGGGSENGFELLHG